MIAVSNKKLRIVEKGESVTVRIPDVDRGRGDFSNIMARVIDIDSKGFLTLGTRHGIISGLFTRGEVVPCSEGFISEHDIPLSNIGLRELSRKESIGTGQGFFKCNCLKKVMEDVNMCKIMYFVIQNVM